MKRTSLFFALVILACILATGCYHSRKTGLQFSGKDKYSTIDIAVAPYNPEPLPASVDFSGAMPPVGNQIPQNSCVAWSLGYGCRSYYAGLDTGVKFITDKQTLDYSGIVSPAFIYNLINNNENKGASLYDALKLLADTGACSFLSMPYQRYNWHKKPGAEQIKEAGKFSITTFRRVDLQYAVGNIKAQLALGTPVVIATLYDKRYYNYGHNTKDSVYLWNEITDVDEDLGHSVLLVGYNDSLQAFKFMNSWGIKWGNQGFGWISYKLAPLVIREAYIIKPANLRDAGIEYADTLKSRGGIYLWADSNKVNILKRTSNVLTDEDRKELGLDFYIDTVTVGTGEPTDEFPKGQLEVTATGGMMIPAKLGSKFQLEVQFYHSQFGVKGTPVLGLDDKYQSANTNATVGTQIFSRAADSSLAGNWKVHIPVAALDVPEGVETAAGYLPAEVELLAEPVLLVDGFHIRTGKCVPVKFNR